MNVIAFSGASGVTEERVASLIVTEMISKVDEIRREFRSTLNGLEALNTRFNRAASMTQPEADNEFRNLDAQLQRLLTLRQSLQVRVDVLLSQQRVIAAPAAHIQQQVA